MIYFRTVPMPVRRCRALSVHAKERGGDCAHDELAGGNAPHLPRTGDLLRARDRILDRAKRLAGFSLGNVTATLLAAVAIGQLGIQVPGPIKSAFFLMFLFAVATAWDHSFSVASARTARSRSSSP